MRSLHVRVEKSVVERYRVEVADDFDETDQMAMQELFTEGVDQPEPYESRDYEFNAFVEDELGVS
jgi:hypothetical protein